jgi:hypothetical protein
MYYLGRGWRVLGGGGVGLDNRFPQICLVACTVQNGTTFDGDYTHAPDHPVGATHKLLDKDGITEDIHLFNDKRR